MRSGSVACGALLASPVDLAAGGSWHTAVMPGPDVPPSHEVCEDLQRSLVESQRLGFLGDRPIDEVVAHARSFVRPLAEVGGSVIDLGSGGGIPGLVVAHDRPDLRVVLVDRRAKRTDFLRRIVSRLGWSDRVEVLNDDVAHVIQRSPDAFDAAVARGFGPPDVTLRAGSGLVCVGGRIVISEPPSGDRWPGELLGDLGLSRVRTNDSTVAVFQRHGFT